MSRDLSRVPSNWPPKVPEVDFKKEMWDYLFGVNSSSEKQANRWTKAKAGKANRSIAPLVARTLRSRSFAATAVQSFVVNVERRSRR